MSKRIGRGMRMNRRPHLECLEERTLMASPAIDPLPSVNVPATKSRIVPITATNSDGNPLIYSVSSTNGAIAARVVDSGVDLKLSVAGYGDLIFELLPNFAPNTVSQITALVNKGFYNGLTFHRVVPSFVIQGGDPAGDGSGGPGFKFEDEFNSEAIFSGDGQLAMANSGKDTNGSQFFATLGPQRFLDFNHTIFGQLVRGFDVMRAIDAAPTDANSKPVTPIVITTASIINDTADAVLVLDAQATGSATINLSVVDNHGSTNSTSFVATAVADTTDDPPILGPVANQVTATGTPIAIPLTATDLENSPMTFAAAVLDSPAHATFTVSGNVVTVTPEAGYKGVINLLVGVKQTNATSRGSSTDPYDKQALTITVKDQTIAPTAASLSGVRGVAVSGKVASFTATIPQAASKFSASINWGDGSTTPGTVAAQADGSYVVNGSHTYSSVQTFSISTSIKDTVSQVTTSAGGTATIGDVAITPTFLGLAPALGTGSFAGTIASFKDADTTSVAADFTASIDWGNGSTTVGTISKAADGAYTVFGVNTYAALGQYPVNVTLVRKNGVTAKATGTLTVANRAPTLDPIDDQTIPEGSTLTVRAAGHDPDTNQTLTYSLAPGTPGDAMIDPTTGVVFWIAAQGPFTTSFTVTVTDSGSPAMSASRSFLVNVAAVAPTVSITPAPGIVPQFNDYTASGSFFDPGLGPWAATVDYGDGSGRVDLPLTADHRFSLDHVYTSAGSFPINVQVIDRNGATGSATVTPSIAAVPPVLLSATIRKAKNAIVGFNVVANGAIGAANVGDLTNYIVVSAGRDKKIGTRDDVIVKFKAATYDSARSTITLTLAKKFTIVGAPQLQVNGLRDTHGRAISRYAATIGKAKLTALSVRK